MLICFLNFSKVIPHDGFLAPEFRRLYKRFAFLLAFVSLTLMMPSFSRGEGVKGKVTSALRETIKLDIGSDDGIKVGDSGRIFYLIKVGDREKPIYIAKFTITQVQEKVATARIKEKTGEVKIGFLVEVEVKGGSLVIQTEPVGATIFINGRSVGVSPYEEKEVSPGSYRIRIIKEGHEAWEEEVTVKIGKKAEVFAQLKKTWMDPQPLCGGSPSPESSLFGCMVDVLRWEAHRVKKGGFPMKDLSMRFVWMGSG